MHSLGGSGKVDHGVGVGGLDEKKNLQILDLQRYL